MHYSCMSSESKGSVQRCPRCLHAPDDKEDPSKLQWHKIEVGATKERYRRHQTDWRKEAAKGTFPDNGWPTLAEAKHYGFDSLQAWYLASKSKTPDGSDEPALKAEFRRLEAANETIEEEDPELALSLLRSYAAFSVSSCS